MNPSFKGFMLSMLMMGVLLSSCGRSTPLSPDDVLAIRIIPEDPVLYLEQLVQLTVEGHYVDGSVKDLTNDPDLLFRVNNHDVIEVLAESKIFGLAAGTVRLFAAYGGREAFIDVTVVDARLEEIEVSPDILQLNPGDYVQLEVLGRLSNGAQLNLTRGETGTGYISDDLTVASVTADGLVFAQEEGQTTVRVEHREFVETVSVTVGEPSVLVSIGVSPAIANLNVGERLQLEVFGYYQDGSVGNLTSHPDTGFSSSDASVATVSDSGLVEALARGDTDITVTHREHSISAAIQVTGGGQVIGIRLIPPAAVLSLGGIIQLQVLADYSDGSQQDVTSSAAYASSDAQVVRVDITGLAVGLSPGQARVTARYLGFEDDCDVQVLDRTLIGIEVTPDEISITAGESIALRVIGTYDDGSQDDLSGHWTGTTYLSSRPEVATVSPDGIVQAISAGETNIEAQNSGHLALARVTVIGPELISLEVDPENLQLGIGESAQLTVWADYSDGSRLDVSGLSGYSTSDGNIARVTAQGLVSARGPGSARITARYGGMSADCLVTVESQLVDIEVQPRAALLDIGDSLQLIVIAYFSDGSSTEVTSLATYITGNSSVAAVSTFGMVTARSAGEATITTYYGGFSDDCRIQVRAPVLVSLETAPSSLELLPGEAVQLTIWAEYSDGSRENVAAFASYSSTDPAVASVSLAGLVTGVAPGAATIRASYGGLTATCPVAVGGMEVIDLNVEPPSATLDIGDTLQLTVTITWSDGRQEDVTFDAQTVYQSADPAVAQVSASGLIGAVGPGLVTVFARAHGFEDSCQVRVLAPQLISVTVEPSAAVLDIGETVQLTVRAFYSDGTVDLVTAQASYDSSDPMVASAQGSGLVVAVGEGLATITASFQGLSGTCQVQVLPPVLEDVWVEPSFANLDIGESTWLTVWARYSDGTTEEVTLPATYLSTNPLVARPLGGGQVLAVGQGSAMITASFGGLSDGCLITVNPPQVVSIEVQPDSMVLDPGDQSSLLVIARYSDGGSGDVTGLSGFISSDPDVASVNDLGWVSALSQGRTTITASYLGFTDECLVDVNPAQLESIEIQPHSAILLVDEILQLLVIAHYNDGSAINISLASDGTTYEVSDPGLLSVDPNGLARALAVTDEVIVTARNSGFEDSASITIWEENPQPYLTSLNPDQLQAGMLPAGFFASGTDFIASTVVRLDGVDLDTTYIDSDTRRASVPLSMIASVGIHQVTVFNPPPGGGSSDALPLYVVDTPTVTTLSPDSAIQGSTVRVVFYGTGLLGCDVVPANPGITTHSVSFGPDGTQLSVTFTVASDATVGPDMVDLTNDAGSTSVIFTVIEDTPLEDLIIGPGEIVFLSGVQAYRNISIGTGAVVFGVGNQPLQFLATGDITVRGEILVNGNPGADGYYDPADGGGAGPGGGGGGGGGDGDSPVPSSGGSGSPPGQGGGPPQGAGTLSGDGGGSGAGRGISGGCGQAGGGGAFGGDGGSGGGDLGIGTGGAGGLANTQGSDYNGGTGGGGGSCCGPNSGGGGGGGGGVLVLSSVTGGSITIRGSLSADGGKGGDGYFGTGGGGGGSGGRVTVTTAGGTIVLEDTISAHGGDGGRSDRGDGGGGGGGGRIIVDAGGGLIDDQWGYYDVRGGAAGESRDNGFSGQPGSIGIADVRP